MFPSGNGAFPGTTGDASQYTQAQQQQNAAMLQLYSQLAQQVNPLLGAAAQNGLLQQQILQLHQQQQLLQQLQRQGVSAQLPATSTATTTEAQQKAAIIDAQNQLLLQQSRLTYPTASSASLVSSASLIPPPPPPPPRPPSNQAHRRLSLMSNMDNQSQRRPAGSTLHPDHNTLHLKTSFEPGSGSTVQPSPIPQTNSPEEEKPPEVTEKRVITEKLETLEKEKKATETQIKSLQTKADGLVAMQHKHEHEGSVEDEDMEEGEDEMNEDDEDMPMEEKIYRQNEHMKAKEHRDKQMVWAPVYIEPYEVPGMAKLEENWKTFKPTLLNMLRRRQQAQELYDKYDTQKYEQMYKEWEDKLHKWENSSKKKRLDATRREIYENTFQEVKKMREDGERGERIDRSDRASRRANLSQVPEGDRGEDDTRMRRAAALPPRQNVLSRDDYYENNNNARTNEGEEYKKRVDDFKSTWTTEEKTIFTQKFAVYGKNFAAISMFLELKAVKDCVWWYYLSKKTVNYKSIFKKKFKVKKSYRPPIMPREDELVHPPLAQQNQGVSAAVESKCCMCNMKIDIALNPGRVLTRSSYDTYGVDPRNTDVKVCARCHSEVTRNRNNNKCLTRSCESAKRKVKTQRTMPPKWKGCDEKLKRFIAHSFGFPREMNKCCLPCFKKITKKLDQLLNGELSSEMEKWELDESMRWPVAELQAVDRLVHEFGQNWTEVAASLCGRSAEECKQQWENRNKEMEGENEDVKEEDQDEQEDQGEAMDQDGGDDDNLTMDVPDSIADNVNEKNEVDEENTMDITEQESPPSPTIDEIGSVGGLLMPFEPPAESSTVVAKPEPCSPPQAPSPEVTVLEEIVRPTPSNAQAGPSAVRPSSTSTPDAKGSITQGTPLMRPPSVQLLDSFPGSSTTPLAQNPLMAAVNSANLYALLQYQHQQQQQQQQQKRQQEQSALSIPADLSKEISDCTIEMKKHELEIQNLERVMHSHMNGTASSVIAQLPISYFEKKLQAEKEKLSEVTRKIATFTNRQQLGNALVQQQVHQQYQLQQLQNFKNAQTKVEQYQKQVETLEDRYQHYSRELNKCQANIIQYTAQINTYQRLNLMGQVQNSQTIAATYQSQLNDCISLRDQTANQLATTKAQLHQAKLVVQQVMMQLSTLPLTTQHNLAAVAAAAAISSTANRTLSDDFRSAAQLSAHTVSHVDGDRKAMGEELKKLETEFHQAVILCERAQGELKNAEVDKQIADKELTQMFTNNLDASEAKERLRAVMTKRETVMERVREAEKMVEALRLRRQQLMECIPRDESALILERGREERERERTGSGSSGSMLMSKGAMKEFKPATPTPPQHSSGIGISSGYFSAQQRQIQQLIPKGSAAGGTPRIGRPLQAGGSLCSGRSAASAEDSRLNVVDKVVHEEVAREQAGSGDRIQRKSGVVTCYLPSADPHKQLPSLPHRRTATPDGRGGGGQSPQLSTTPHGTQYPSSSSASVLQSSSSQMATPPSTQSLPSSFPALFGEPGKSSDGGGQMMSQLRLNELPSSISASLPSSTPSTTTSSSFMMPTATPPQSLSFSVSSSTPTLPPTYEPLSPEGESPPPSPPLSHTTSAQRSESGESSGAGQRQMFSILNLDDSPTETEDARPAPILAPPPFLQFGTLPTATTESGAQPPQFEPLSDDDDDL